MPLSAKPFSQACENNKRVILNHICDRFQPGNVVLEIGSGTAQHVTFFAEMMPQVHWQPTDTPQNITSLLEGLADHRFHNIAAPLALDVTHIPWPLASADAVGGGVDGVFTANTLHIMPYEAVACFFSGVGNVLLPSGKLCVYGPFKYEGEFTTPSNASFDAHLKGFDPQMGIREFEHVQALAQAQMLELVADYDMPSNNQLLVWQMRK